MNCKLGVVYMIISPTNRIYIGSTINLKKRISTYKNNNNNGQIKIYNSIRKHGWVNHKLKIIWSGNPHKKRRRRKDLTGVILEVVVEVNGKRIKSLNGEINKVTN